MNKKIGFLLLLAVVFFELKWVTGSPDPVLNQTPLPLHLYPKSIHVKEGQMATWYLTAAGAEPLQYQWKLNGHDVVGANANTLRIVSTKMSDQGNYVCVIKNKFGSIQTETVKLTLTPKPDLGVAERIETNDAPQNTTASTLK